MAIVFGMFIENAGVPVPSEPMLLFSGYLIYLGALNFPGVLGAAVAGSLAGSLVMYWIGAAGGRPFIHKYGRYVRLTPEALARAEAWFSRFGKGAVSGARIIPIVRTWVSLPAGVARMSLAQYILFTAIGVTLWNSAMILTGLALGAGWESVEIRIWSWDVVVVVAPLLFLGGLVVFLTLRARARRRSRANGG